MTEERERDPLQPRMERFERQWREQARRPPRQNAGEAARRVLARLDEISPTASRERGVGSWRWRLATAMVVAVAATGLWLLSPGLPPTVSGPDPQLPAAEAETPVMADGVVLMWLDAETPLYMTFAPPAPERAVVAGAGKGEES